MAIQYSSSNIKVGYDTLNKCYDDVGGGVGCSFWAIRNILILKINKSILKLKRYVKSKCFYYVQ